MNCPKCGTPASDGVAHCRRCGAALSGKAAAPSSSDEIDLMPLEESKPPAHSSFEPPPGLLQPPPSQGAKAGPANPTAPSAADYVPRIRGGGASPPKGNTNIIIGGVLLALLVGFIAWRMFRTKNELIAGRAKVETSVLLQPNQSRVENLDVSGKMTYSLDVNAVDVEVSVGVFKRSPKDPTSIAALKKLAEGFEIVRKGETSSKTGELTTGQYSWIIINEGKKPARAKLKFSIQ